WTGKLVPGVATTATLEHVAYLPPRAATAPHPMPIFIEHSLPAPYGLPTPGSERYKLGLHHDGAAIDADGTRAVVAAVLDRLAAAARAWLPEYDWEHAEIDTCVYDNTDDEDFVIERRGNVVVGAGTSGHGFKFGVLLGEVLASLALGVTPSI